MMKKLMLCFAVLCSGLAAEPNFYDFLARTFMKSGEIKPDNPTLLAKVDEKKKKIDVQIHAIKDVEQKVMFAELLSKLHAGEPNSSVLSFDGVEQLNLINVSAEKASLSKQLAVQTIFGDVVMAKLLAQPLTDVPTILKRQQAIKIIADNAELRAQLVQALSDIKQGQALLFTFFDTNNVLNEDVLKTLYGMLPEWLHKNSPALYAMRGLKNWYTGFLLSTAYYPLALMIRLMYRGPGSGATALQKIGYYLSVPVTSYYDMAKTIGYAHNPYSYVNLWRGKKMADLAEIIAPDKAEAARLEEVNFEIGENVQNLLDQHLGPIPANFRGSMDEFEAKKAARISLGKKCAVGVGLATALYDALSVYQIYKTIGDLKVDHAIFTNMQTRLIGVARIVRGLHTLQELLQKYPTLQETVPSFKKITELFETGGEVGKLVQLLQTNTFAGEPSFFSNGVHILVAYKLMNEYKDSLSPALEAAGEFDAYTTLATCMSSPERGVYCYAQFIDNARPVIQLDGFWNPLMAPAKAVLNSVYFDQGHDKNMLLTGPNGSGKSTNMEAVCYNVLLMEVFGIAAARSACITPFDHINVYLAVQENIQEGQSTFMAEAQLLNKICAAVVASKPTERSFTIVDEGLRGTVAQEAEVRLTQAIETLVSVPQDLCIFATHLEQPTKLEAKLGGAISNYYVGLEEPTPGTFIRTFKMMRGVNSWWFADAEKRKRFIDWLLKNKTT